MNVLIIEDEPQAAEYLSRIVPELLPGSVVVARVDTVKKAVQWFQQNSSPDLALMDIQLADGISFEIFEKVSVPCPVIFITAYDEYALRAFKVNSIDYILKPVDKAELARALAKFKQQKGPSDPSALMASITAAMAMVNRRYKARFVIKVGEHLRTIETSSIRFFFSQDKITFCVTDDNRSQILDHTLDQLQDMVDPDVYFRINRKYLVSAAAIQDIITYSNSRLKLILEGSDDNDVIVARERVQDFKSWLDR